MSKKVYLAGPMSGMPDLNFPAFRRAREELRAAGHTVFCPAEHAEQTESEVSAEKNASQEFRRRVLAIDLAWICAQADAIVLLPGWRRSKGATAEHATAVALGLEVLEVPTDGAEPDPAQVRHPKL